MWKRKKKQCTSYQFTDFRLHIVTLGPALQCWNRLLKHFFFTVRSLQIFVSKCCFKVEGSSSSWFGLMSFAFPRPLHTVPWCCVWWHPAVLCLSCPPRPYSPSTILLLQHKTDDSSVSLLQWVPHTPGFTGITPKSLWTPANGLLCVSCSVLSNS